uniref:Transthyretin-like family protein n=1 Tax=Parastrongyloides trichosuri TaxID=131310 RepID=A0A0N4ZXU4_PARTI
MVSKAALFAVVIILNLFVFTLSTRFLISGTLKCNGSLFPGAKVSLCDGQSETKPKETTTSDKDGHFRLRADLSSQDYIYKVSIYYNCSLNNNKQSNESVYTRQRHYYSLVNQNNQAQSNTEYRSPIDNIPDLINATSDARYQHCNKD